MIVRYHSSSQKKENMQELRLPSFTVTFGILKGDPAALDTADRSDRPIVVVAVDKHSQDVMLQRKLGENYVSSKERLRDLQTFHVPSLREEPVAANVTRALLYHDMAAYGVGTKDGDPPIPPSQHFLSAVVEQVLQGIYKQGGMASLIEAIRQIV